MEWKAKNTANTFTNCKIFFTACNTVIRNRDKHKRTKVTDPEFHSTNSTSEMEDRLCKKMRW